jgi:penicillin-binding protein 1C
MHRLRALLRRRWFWAIAAVVVVAGWLRLGPLPAGLLDQAAHESTAVVDRHGEVLYESRSAFGTRGERMGEGDLPPALVQATLAAEDERYRSHPGVDPIAMGRALWRNVRAGRVVQGGSTITQQVVKLLLARRDGAGRARGWMTKAREAVYALRLEHRLDKTEILALYLSLAPYGNQVEGAARASQEYFGRDAATLTAAEAAFLAALPQQPTRYNPWRDAATARGRQIRILDRMLSRGWLTPAAHRVAVAERLALSRGRSGSVAPHFVERVLGAAGPAAPARIDTTLDARLQRIVGGIIAARRGDLERHEAHNVAVAVLDNRTGQWLAWEGSGDYFDAAHGGTIDGVVTPRQPGSALKPFTYAAAFERGAHPARVLPDVPSEFPTAEPGILYRPRNYDGQYRGPLSARAALAGSENVPAVALAAEVGVPAVLRLLRASGFSTLDNNADHYGLGITLGNAEVTLADLVAGYAMIARGGIRVRPTWLLAGAADAAMRARERVLDERTAFWIADILSDDDARAYIFGRGGSLEFPFTVAAKTGTSQAYHDNWAVGFTRDVTVGVWVGNFDRRPLVASSGVTGAGPIFHDVMLAAVEHVRGELPVGDRAPILMPGTDVRRESVCALSGLSPTGACPRRTSEWLPAETPLPDCTWHRAGPGGVVTVWPAAYHAWSGSADVPGSMEIAPATGRPTTRASGSPPAGALEIVSPLAGATYLRDPTLRAEFQTLPLRARSETGRVEWRVNGTFVGKSAPGAPVRWPLQTGKHLIEVKDAQGRTATTTVTVK